MSPRVRTALIALAAAVVAALIAVLVVSCGSSDAAEIEDVTHEYVEDIKEEDYESACEKLSRRAIRELEAIGVGLDAEGCPEILEVVVEYYEDDVADDTGDVSDIEVDDDRATADNEDAKPGEDDTNDYVEEDGDWKLDAPPLVPQPIPPPPPPVETPTPEPTPGAPEETPTPSPEPEQDPDPEREAPELSVSEQGFTSTDAGVSYGAIVENPSSTADALTVTVTITLLADGAVVETETETLAGIPAGEEFAIGGDADESVDEIQVTAVAAQAGPPGELELPTTSAELVRDDDKLTVSIAVTNTLDAALSPDVFAVLRDEDGKIVGGVSGDGDSIEPGASATVNLTAIDELPSAASAVGAATPD